MNAASWLDCEQITAADGLEALLRVSSAEAVLNATSAQSGWTGDGSGRTVACSPRSSYRYERKNRSGEKRTIYDDFVSCDWCVW